MFAIVFPVSHFFGQQAFLASILIASAMMPFVLALWVARRIRAKFVLHGALVGLVASLIYLGLAWRQPTAASVQNRARAQDCGWGGWRHPGFAPEANGGMTCDDRGD